MEKKIQQIQRVFDHNPIPFMIYRLLKNESDVYTEYEIAYANQAALDLLGYAGDNLIGKTVAPVSEEKLRFLLCAHEDNGKIHEIRFDEHCNKYLDMTAYRESEGYVAFVMNDITLQKEKEEEARVQRDRYGHLLDAIPSGIAVFDIVRHESVTMNYFNDELCKITGYSREEIKERGSEKLCEAIPEDLDDVKKEMSQAVLTFSTKELQYRTYKKNGELRNIQVRISVEETGEDTISTYVVYTDITTQMQMQQAIATEMSYLKEAQGDHLLSKCRANISKDIVDNYVITSKLETTTDTSLYSEAVKGVVSQCATRTMGEDFTRFMGPEALLRSYEQGIHDVSFEYMRYTVDKEVLWVRTTVKIYPSPESHDIMCFMYTYDIDQEKTLEMIVDHVAETNFDMMALVNVDKKKIYCVRKSDIEVSMGLHRNHVFRDCNQMFVKRYVAEEFQEEVREQLELERIQEELKQKKVDSFVFPIQYMGVTYHKRLDFSYLDDSQEVLIMTRSDVTELIQEQELQRENLKNALLQAEQASHAKTDFLSNMSHEIRTPMNAIIGMSTLAAQCINDPEQVSDCISKVGISARFLLSLINDILDMSRIESGKVVLKQEKFSFEQMIHNINTIIYNQAKTKDIDYDCVITSFIRPNYVGDEMKLQQVLINLLGNAIKFTQAGGKTQFIIHQDRIEHGKAYMTFTINDTGIGISEEFQKHMFEPFEQGQMSGNTTYQGTGLGLAICKNLVDMMGGSINVNSIEGVGSEFSVKIPLEVSSDDKEYQMTKDIHLEKMKALIVDDDIVICENTQKVLCDMGMKAEWASSGRQAISMVGDWKNKQRFFDVILLDWKMPEMDGIETAREIRKIVGPDVTIIVMTAYDWSVIEQEAKAAGVNCLVSKPLFKTTLISTFQRVFSTNDRMEEEKKREYDFSNRNILLVEDHILNIEVAKKLLAKNHANVEVAENGLRAIELFTKSEGGFYDAILMDIRMPVMDGLTAARSIRHLQNKDAKTVPIIAMSANAFDEDVEKSKAAGMNAHLAKPIEPEKLYETLQHYFVQ